MDDEPSVYLTFDPESYRTVAACLSAFHFGDSATVEELLDGAGRDWAAAAVTILHALVTQAAEHCGVTVETQLQHFGWAAAMTAEDER